MPKSVSRFPSSPILPVDDWPILLDHLISLPRDHWYIAFEIWLWALAFNSLPRFMWPLNSGTGCVYSGPQWVKLKVKPQLSLNDFLCKLVLPCQEIWKWRNCCTVVLVKTIRKMTDHPTPEPVGALKLLGLLEASKDSVCVQLHSFVH